MHENSNIYIYIYIYIYVCVCMCVCVCVCERIPAQDRKYFRKNIYREKYEIPLG